MRKALEIFDEAFMHEMKSTNRRELRERTDKQAANVDIDFWISEVLCIIKYIWQRGARVSNDTTDNYVDECARYGLESNEIDNQPSTPDAYLGIYVY